MVRFRELYKGEKEPVLLSGWTSTGRSGDQYYFIYVTSTGQLVDQYWSTRRPVLVNSSTSTGSHYLPSEIALVFLLHCSFVAVYDTCSLVG